MVDFLKELDNTFRERCLDTHNVYLKSVADIIAQTYDAGNLRETSIKMVDSIISQQANLEEKKIDPGHETPEFRNLRNCWYHECALNYPFGSSNFNVDDRLKFASWKIIQCYYSIFASIASLVCCYNKKRKRVKTTLNLFASNFLCNKRRKKFFLPPVNIYLNQQDQIPEELLDKITWDYGQKVHIPNIYEALKTVKTEEKDNVRITIPHYLKFLRDWVTYQDAYLLFRLYGQSPKQDLDFSLKRITFIHCLQTEFYLLNLFGWEAIKRQYVAFSTELRNNLNIKSVPLSARIKAYTILM